MRESTAGRLTKQEGAGLAIAAAAHAALLGVLMLSPPGKTVKPPPQRMEVTFSEEISQQSTSPDPMAEAAPDVAPELGEAQPEPVVEPQAQPEPPRSEPQRPLPAPPKPQPAPAPKPQPAPVPKPAPKPVPKPQPAPPKPAPKPTAKPAPAPAKPAPAKAAPAKAAPAKSAPAKTATAETSPRRRPDAPAGGSRIGDDFLKGIPGATKPGTAKTAPAATIGPDVRSSLAGAISREIKPHWAAPQGVDADKLVTILAWDLNADGTLAGRPRVVDQQGITPANEAQAKRHAEQAIRAVQLAAPFELPEMYYSGWKRITAFRFDRKLSQ